MTCSVAAWVFALAMLLFALGILHALYVVSTEYAKLLREVRDD